MSVSFLSECKEKVLSRIDALIPDKNKITASMRYSALADSKCIRAGLIFASGNLNKEISDSALIDMATSIELMHTYSLIHDDLPSMDNDDIRRGKASNHIKFNEATAILTGDALQALAYETIAASPDLTHEQKIESIKALSNACGFEGMILGQQYDLDAENNEYDDIKKIHELKTGKLIQVAITLPHLGNEKYENERMILHEIGKGLGLAFQITDDILEEVSDEKTLGKNVNSDKRNDKSTYLKVVSLNEAINISQELSMSAISDLEKLKNKRFDMLIELAKYISYRNN